MIYNFESEEHVNLARNQLETTGRFEYEHERLYMLDGDIFAVKYEPVFRKINGQIFAFADDPTVVLQVVQTHYYETFTIGIFPCTKDGIRHALLLAHILQAYDEDGDIDTVEIRQLKLGTNLNLTEDSTFYEMATWKEFKGNSTGESHVNKLKFKQSWCIRPTGLKVRQKFIEDIDACDCYDEGWHVVGQKVYQFPNGDQCTLIEYQRTIVARSLDEANKIAEESMKEYFDTHPFDPSWEPAGPDEYLDSKYWNSTEVRKSVTGRMFLEGGE